MSQTTTRERSALDQFAEQPLRDPDAGTVPAIIEPHTLAILSRSEIDAQADKASTQPRSFKAFRQTVHDLITINDDAAAECFYSLPGRAKRDNPDEKGEPIEGPSIRFAEILIYAWRNVRIGTRVIDEGGAAITAQGIVNDLENNVVTTSETRRRIVDRRGRRYSPDMINMTANAACAIARRNSILQAIPKPLWHDLYREARITAAGAPERLAQRRDAAIAYFEKAGVAADRIFRALGVPDRDAIGIDELITLRGTITAVRDGEISLAEAFPPVGERPADVADKAASALDAFAAGAVSSGDPSSGKQAPTTETGGGEGLQQASAAADAGSPAEAPPAPAGEGSDARPSPPEHATSLPPDQETLRSDTITSVLQLATRADLDADERLARLDDIRAELTDHTALQPAFIKPLIETAARVIRKELTKVAAQKYLASLKER